MNDIKNSQLLEKLLQCAKEVIPGEKVVTAERIILAAIQLVSEGDASQNEELKELKSVLVSNREIQKIESLLRQRVEASRSTYDQVYYMQKKMVEAKAIAKGEKKKTLSAPELLTCILKDPSTMLQECLSGKSGQEKKKEIPNAESEEELEVEFELEEEETKLGIAELTKKVKAIQENLLGTVFGQDHAVSAFVSGYFQGEILNMTDKSRVRPRGIFLFAGPPGVGKTFLAEKGAEALGIPFARFDMSGYADREASLQFAGMDKAYRGATEGTVTGFVKKNPQCVLLFDEIEKANISVIHLFLQLLDAGRVHDNYLDEEVSFKDALVIFTTNAGRNLYETSETGDFSGISRKTILKALEKDVNPETGVPFFPPAICSRFATGKVLMFNQVTAHDLRAIGKKEILKCAENFQREMNISIRLDEDVFTALLFAEGGKADARTIRSRAETFFNDEVFELFRLLASEKSYAEIDRLEEIHIGVDLPENPSLRGMFHREEKTEILVFGDENSAALCEKAGADCTVYHASSKEEAVEYLDKKDVRFLILDFGFLPAEESVVLNAEDVPSTGRDFFHYAKKYYSEIPIYLLQREDNHYSNEEMVSFFRMGVRGFIPIDETGNALKEKISDLCVSMNQQDSMLSLAKENKLLNFETSQTISADGKEAEVILFDFKTEQVLEAEDSQNVVSDVSRPNVRFDEVIGAGDAKKELEYFVSYLKNPKKFRGTGVKAPKGVILYGPPGTGKTMLAKAMACESGVTFIAAEGNQFLKKYVGEGPEEVHKLFRTARKYAPAILFIDEIDAIGKERDGSEHSQITADVLTAFLTEMDGFKVDPKKPIFVLAATNFEVEPGRAKSLDEALLRRFDRRILIDLPNKEDRLRFMKKKMEESTAFEISEEKMDNLAIRSTGMSLALLDSVFEMALRSAVRDGNFKVTDEILDEAFETFRSGDVKKWDISQLERVARHEAGHAFLCWHSGETPSYLTVVARGDHGGYMQHADNEGKAIYTKEDLLARIRISLGGRAAELVYYGEGDGISTGASGDLASASRVAKRMICDYGMCASIGMATLDDSQTLPEAVRNEMNRILNEEMEKAIRLISENKKAMDEMVGILLSKNHLSGAEIDEVFSKNAKR